MTRAVLPNTSAREQWLLAGLKDRATNLWARTPPSVDGGEDEDADTGTDTSVLDDNNDDNASFTSQQTTAFDSPNLRPSRTRLLEESSPSDGPHAGPRGTVCSVTIEYGVYMQHGGIRRAPHTAAQMASRPRGPQHQRALTNTLALPGGTREFSLLVLDLA